MIDPTALHAWTHANRMARAAYYADPNPCRDWCPVCVRPRGSTNCPRCQDVQRLRAKRSKP